MRSAGTCAAGSAQWSLVLCAGQVKRLLHWPVLLLSDAWVTLGATLPPDRNKSAGKNRGGKSGKVADFRYKRPPQPDARTSGREARGKGANGAARPRPDLADIGAMRPTGHGEAYAALDLGTNNCRLLIARPSGRDFTVIDAFSRVVKLGEGLATSGRLSDAAMDRTLAALPR